MLVLLITNGIPKTFNEFRLLLIDFKKYLYVDPQLTPCAFTLTAIVYEKEKTE